jgi:hypothetical protein
MLACRDSIAMEHARMQPNVGQHNAIRLGHERHAEAMRLTEEPSETARRLRTASGIVRTARHEYTDGVLNAVRNECNRLYESIHPGEGLGLSALRLDPNARNSLHQDATFGAVGGVPPQAYYSDAHLDTLGFCIWLAVQRRATGGRCIVVLDDLFTSVDLVHLDRIVDLLAEEAEFFDQLILATHYRRWRDKYKFGTGTNRVEVIELAGWSHAVGIRAGRGLPAVQELEGKLAMVPLDRQGVASLAGVLLEAVLDHLSLLYRCTMPRSATNEYELKALLDGTTKLAKQLVVERDVIGEDGQVKVDRVTIRTFHDAVKATYVIRNQVGAHYNPVGADVPDREVEAYGRLTHQLVSALCCRSCGEIARRNQGTHLSCGCKKHRMTPLQLA